MHAIKNTILIVDDEPQIRKMLNVLLNSSDYKIEESESAKQALRMAVSLKPNIILLDLGLPDGDGKDVVTALREWTQVPIIILSACDDEEEIALALDIGADDYVTKPFNIGVLSARIRANLRRNAVREAGEPIVNNGPIRMDLVRHEVFCNGVPVNLTPKEYGLLHYFITHRGKVLTHRQTLKDVWGSAHVEDTQYLRVYVGQLRDKLEQYSTQKLIVTVSGVGYRMEILDQDEQAAVPVENIIQAAVA